MPAYRSTTLALHPARTSHCLSLLFLSLWTIAFHFRSFAFYYSLLFLPLVKLNASCLCCALAQCTPQVQQAPPPPPSSTPPSRPLMSRKRTRRLRCYVCDGKWTDEEFRIKQNEFNRWNPERSGNHRVYLNEQQMQHLRSFFTPAGELAVLCRQHLREYASIGTTVLRQIQQGVMRVADQIGRASCRERV